MSGTIGSSAATRAGADGYTLLFGAASTLAVVPQLNTSAGYDPLKDFVPVGGIASVASVLVTGKPAVYPGLSAVHAAAKARPDALTYGSAGSGTSQHMQMAQYNLDHGLTMMHVPYRGGAPAMTGLMGGQIDFLMEPVATALPHVRSGRISALAISQAERSKLLPDVPTFAQAGVPDYEVSTWFALMAPAGIGEAELATMSNALTQVLADPGIVAALNERGVDAMPRPSAQMRGFIEQEYALWGRVIQKAGIAVQ